MSNNPTWLMLDLESSRVLSWDRCCLTCMTTISRTAYRRVETADDDTDDDAADDTTIYQHSAPKNLNSCIQAMNENLQSIESWACASNLLLNEKKTKQMLVTTPQMSRVHELGTLTLTLKLKDQILDRVDKFKLLGTWLAEDLKWAHHVNQVTSSCYKVLSTLRKIKNMNPQDIKKSLAQSLVLSKLNFNDSVTYPFPAFLQKRVQRVQNVAAGFVLNRFCTESNILRLGWLPTLELTLSSTFSSLWPENLKLTRHSTQRQLRSSNAPLLQISLVKGTFQDAAANLFNKLPAHLRLCSDFNTFKRECSHILRNKASIHISSN